MLKRIYRIRITPIFNVNIIKIQTFDVLKVYMIMFLDTVVYLRVANDRTEERFISSETNIYP